MFWKTSSRVGLLFIFGAGNGLWQQQAAAQDDTGAQLSSGKSKSEMAEVFSAMGADPTLREMKRESELLELQQIYGEFAREQRMNAQQSERFFLLLLGEIDSGDRPAANGSDEIAEAWREDEKERWRQLRVLLGEAGYGRFQDYMKGVSERLAVAQMREHLGSRHILLTEAQAKTFLQILWEERAKTTRVVFDPRAAIPTEENTRIALEGDNLERYVEAQTGLDARVLRRAAALLSPEQLRAVDSFQQRHLAAQKVGFEVVRERIRRENAAAETPAQSSP